MTDIFFCSDFLQTHLDTCHYFYDTNNKLLLQIVTCEHSYQLRKQFSAGVKITFFNKENLGIVSLLIKPLEFCFCLLSLNRILSFWSTEVNPKASGSQTFWFRILLCSRWGIQRTFCLYGLSLFIFTVLEIKTEKLKLKIFINLFKIRVIKPLHMTHQINMNNILIKIIIFSKMKII